jgi:probable addiction module antidote protein
MGSWVGFLRTWYKIAKEAGLGRESLYKALSPGAHPRFETVNAVLRALGVKFAVVSAESQPASHGSEVR